VQEIFAKIPTATKTLILFFYPSTVGYSREEENRQLGKVHLTLDSSILCSISWAVMRSGISPGLTTTALGVSGELT
jgi:hypothetical protein